MEHQVYCSIFLFINSSSGGGVGQKLVAQEVEKMSFTLNIQDITGHHEDQIHVYFYNMRKNKEKGFDKLKAITDQNKKAIAVICGGDGTVMWVVNQLVQYKIDLKKAPISIIPLGTGNDFSRCLGWGKEQTILTENSFETLKKLIKDWIEAEQQDLDIWHVHAKLYPHGAFYKIIDQKDKEIQGKSISKSFCNYFSFGIDGQVGYDFDKYRTTSRLGNLAVYGAMGIASNFQKIKTMGELLEYILDESDGKVEIIYHGEKAKTVQQLIGSNIFDMKISWNDVIDNINYSFSLNNFQNIVALNINSYMGGVKDIWKKASQVQMMKKSTHQVQETKHSDGKIQLVSFASTTSIGIEKAINKFSQIGFSQKVWQGKGPFRFKFRPEPNKQKQNVTYIQIDGQFIKVNHLDEICLKISEEVPGGKICVLKRKGQPL